MTGQLSASSVKGVDQPLVPSRQPFAGAALPFCGGAVVRAEELALIAEGVEEGGASEGLLDHDVHLPADRVPRADETEELEASLRNVVPGDAAIENIEIEPLDAMQLAVVVRYALVPRRTDIRCSRDLRGSIRSTCGGQRGRALAT